MKNNPSMIHCPVVGMMGNGVTISEFKQRLLAFQKVYTLFDKKISKGAGNNAKLCSTNPFEGEKPFWVVLQNPR